MIEWWGPVIYEYYGGTETERGHFREVEDGSSIPAPSARLKGAELRILGDGGNCRRARPARSLRASRIPDFTYHGDGKARRVERDGLISSAISAISTRTAFSSLRPQARHGDFGRRQHLPRRDRSRAARGAGRGDCAVFGIPDEEFGEALMAVVEPQAGVSLDLGGIRAQLLTQLADYKVPKRVEIRPAAARRQRQDLQAPPARPLLGESGKADLK